MKHSLSMSLPLDNYYEDPWENDFSMYLTNAAGEPLDLVEVIQEQDEEKPPYNHRADWIS